MIDWFTTDGKFLEGIIDGVFWLIEGERRDSTINDDTD